MSCWAVQSASPALPLSRKAAVNHVDDLAVAVALRETRAHRGALARAAEDAHGAFRIDPFGKVADLVVRLVARPGDVASVTLGLLAYVQYLDRAAY